MTSPEATSRAPGPKPEDRKNNIDKRFAELMRWKEESDMPVMSCIMVVPPFAAQIMNELLPATLRR